MLVVLAYYLIPAPQNGAIIAETKGQGALLNQYSDFCCSQRHDDLAAAVANARLNSTTQRLPLKPVAFSDPLMASPPRRGHRISACGFFLNPH